MAKDDGAIGLNSGLNGLNSYIAAGAEILQAPIC